MIACTSFAECPQLDGPFALMWVPTTRIPVSRPMRIVSAIPSVPVRVGPSTMLGTCQRGIGDWLR